MNKAILAVVFFAFASLVVAKPQDSLKTRTTSAAQNILDLIKAHPCEILYSETSRAEYDACLSERRSAFASDHYAVVSGLLAEFKAKGLNTEFIRGEAKSGNAERVYVGLLELANQ